MYLDRLLILSVFAVASCGLAYELIAGALASYLLGDSVMQFSSIIGAYLFAMGVGSHLSKYVKDEDVISRFIEIELLVGLIGGLSATVLFLTFAHASTPFRSVMYALVFVVGVLVGMEIPLVMRIFNARKAAFSDIVSRVLTFDYLGALAVSLVFPLVLAPKLGLSRSALLFGLANAGVALVTAWAFRAELPKLRALMSRGVCVTVLLLAGFASAERLVAWSEKSLFGDEIIYSMTSQYQRLVVTRWKGDMRLHINGNLQFSSKDEHRYHEALVHPVMASLPWAKHVLVMGGGDGLAVREILKYKNVETITLVDLDPEMTKLFTTAPELVALNRGSLLDPRVKVINSDAAQWLETADKVYDAIIVDFPDPTNFALGKLYSVPFYRLMKKHMAENGLAVIQATSPYFGPRSYWTVDATLKEVGYKTAPYHAYVPSFGDWGFILCSNKGYKLPDKYTVPLKWLDASTTRLMFDFPADMAPLKMAPNYLNSQSLVHAFEEDWAKVIR